MGRGEGGQALPSVQGLERDLALVTIEGTLRARFTKALLVKGGAPASRRALIVKALALVDERELAVASTTLAGEDIEALLVRVGEMVTELLPGLCPRRTIVVALEAVKWIVDPDDPTCHSREADALLERALARPHDLAPASERLEQLLYFLAFIASDNSKRVALCFSRAETLAEPDMSDFIRAFKHAIADGDELLLVLDGLKKLHQQLYRADQDTEMMFHVAKLTA